MRCSSNNLIKAIKKFSTYFFFLIVLINPLYFFTDDVSIEYFVIHNCNFKLGKTSLAFKKHENSL